MSEAASVNFQEQEGGLVAAFSDGKRTEFKLPIRTFKIDVSNLCASHSCEWDDKDKVDGLVTRVLFGDGVLLDYGIEVIGKPNSKSKNISVSIRSADFEKNCSDEASQNLINASLSYTESDWEIGNRSEWWVELCVPSKVFDEVQSLFQSKRLGSLKIGLNSDDLYVTAGDYYAPISNPVTWFIKDGQYGAELAHCSTRTFYMRELPLVLRNEEQFDEVYLEPPVAEETCGQDRTAPIGQEILSAKVEALSKDLKILFWGLIAIAAAILFAK